jgi:hypothetical protein
MKLWFENIVAYLLKARTVESEKQPLLDNFWKAVFSVGSVPRLYNEDQLLLRDSFETAVRRVGGRMDVSPGAEERPLLKPLSSNGY